MFLATRCYLELPLKIRKVQGTISEKKRAEKVVAYILDKYGSPHAFKLLKYFLEHKLAREKKGFAIYEITFNIAPSEVLTRYALMKIECIADDGEEKDAEAGLELLLRKGILKADPETEILELNVPLSSIANIYLKETKKSMKVVKDKSLADVILLPATARRVKASKKGSKDLSKVSGVPDLLERDGHRHIVLTEMKFSTSL